MSRLLAQVNKFVVWEKSEDSSAYSGYCCLSTTGTESVNVAALGLSSKAPT
jgi:hypothetical protein